MGIGNRARSWLTNASVLVGTLVLVTAAGEVVLRMSPALLPKGAYGSTRYDPEIGLRVHAAPAIYNKVRYVRRSPNRDGFLDVEHERSKPEGVLRVGFFGDSYVEAAQVPLDSTFYRRLPQEIAGRPTEWFGFGFSGWGTLHSLMSYRVQGPRYDLDHVVYVFVKNDPGDHAFAFRSREGVPSATLTDSGPGFEVRSGRGDWRRLHENPSLGRRIGKAIQRRSLLANVLLTQFRLVRLTRAAPTAPPEDAGPPPSMASQRPPNQNDLPSTWPPELLRDTQELTRRILRAFAAEVREDGRQFAVLYVPRYEAELDGNLEEANVWLHWLSRVCEELGIALIDPSPVLREGLEAGRPMYDDHWTPAGHRVIAGALTAYFASAIDSLSGAGLDGTDR